MDSNSVTFQATDWQTEENDEQVTVYIYGLTIENKNVVVKIPDFKPYVYLELDAKIRWSQANVELVKAFLRERLGSNFPVKVKLVERKKNYYYKQAKFLWLAFSTVKAIRFLESAVRGYVNILGIGKIKLTVHEQRAGPILQLMTMRKLTPSGWITAKKTIKAPLLEEFGETFSTCDIEILSSYSDINPEKNVVGVTKPKVLCYDLECVSGDTTGNTFPNPTKITDQVICVSATVGYTHLAESTWKTYCLVNEDGGRVCPNNVGDGSEIRHFASEKDLLLGWRDFVNEINPDVITGYNTLSFDDNYLSERANIRLCWSKFAIMGRLIGTKNKMEERRWNSSAYGDQCFKYMHIPGRLHIDMFPVISKDYTNLQSYTLNSVSEEFLGDHKVDLPAKEMIQIWHRGETEDIRKIVEYCNKDTLLPLRLMKKMNTWLGLTEMSNVMMVSIFDLITRGQQIRVFSQVYSMALDLGVVCTEKWTDYKPTEEEKIFVGATVQDPQVGYWERVATYDFCLAGDTLISLANGISKRIDQMNDDYKVLAYQKSGFQPQMTSDGLQIKGEKETIKLVLAYGRTIVCTPEHKFMLEDGTWEYAKNLIGKNIKCGIEYPEDVKCELESKWSMVIDGEKFDMLANRDKTLAFSRILGYILSDGSIYITKRDNRQCAEVYLGSALDADNLQQDLRLLSNVQVTTRIRNGNRSKNSDIKGQTFCISLPSNLAKKIHQIKGIVIGKRATQIMKLPEFITDTNCPLAIVREFIGGLFGGDGTAPSLSNNNFSSVSFKWTTIEKFRLQMEFVFKDIKKILERFDIKTGDIKSCKIKYPDERLRPKDYLENPRYDYLLRIGNDNCAKFSRKIGFRYCINKEYKTFIVRLYYDYCDLVRKQHKKVVMRANALYKQSGEKGCKNSLELARKEFLEDNIPVHPLVLSSVRDLNYMRSEEKRRTTHRISLQYKKNFPKPLDFLNDLGIVDWFNKNEYIIKQDSTEIPCFRQKVVTINSNETLPVYDIQVNVAHNFIANGLVAHNCSLYPTTIIAYNLCFSTFVPPGENPPKEDYHDLQWEEHISCPHDKSVRKTKPTKVICGSHHYRFYKAEVKKVLYQCFWYIG